MAENEGFGGDHLREATSFSQLLLADDDGDVAAGLDVDNSFSYSSVFSSEKPPRMLCFGDYHHDSELVYPETTTTPQKSGVSCSDSSTASSSNNGGVNTLSKSVKKRNGSGPEFVTAVAVASQRTSKKTKTETPSPAGHAKRKEKLGERITTLQQLVSPFGKTDTASVLHEAMGYIRFLHEQVQVLCSPYLQRLPSSSSHTAPGGVGGGGGGGENGEDGRKDLRSQGLCLVPVESTSHVANSNGADFWSPAAMGSNAPSSTK